MTDVSSGIFYKKWDILLFIMQIMRGVLPMTTTKQTPAAALPVTNEYGYFEIRLESIGGLGANLCGKMLGELGATLLSYNSLSFASYGSEKRGSPVKSYIRWCAADKPLRANSPVTKPHLLGIFHEGLFGTYPVLDGVSSDTIIVLNTPLPADKAADKYHISAGHLYCVDALSIAMESHSRINMILLGAIAKASGFIPLEAVLQLCRDTVGKKYPGLIDANLAGVRQGFSGLSEISGSNKTSDISKTSGINETSDKSDGTAPSKSPREQFVWGYANAPIGGINPRIGSTVSNDLSPSREGYFPLFLKERCINCGQCDSTCPDMVFQFAPGIYKNRECMVNMGLDYYHCKGCLRCVTVCPTAALVSAKEADYPRKPYAMQNQHLLPDSLTYQKDGADSWITSESYLDEKRIDGGVL